MSENNDLIVQLEREEFELIKWLIAVSAKDAPRPILNFFHVRENGIFEAANGYQLHRMKVPTKLKDKFPLGLYKLIASFHDPDGTKGSRTAIFRPAPEDYKFPDLSIVEPDIHNYTTEEDLKLSVLTGIKPALLISALAPLKSTTGLALRFRDNHSPFVLSGEFNNAEIQTVIMPCHIDGIDHETQLETLQRFVANWATNDPAYTLEVIRKQAQFLIRRFGIPIKIKPDAK